MNANFLVSQYIAAKQAMIEGYRGMHKAPEYLSWNDVQDLQDTMQSAAVALAEYMVSIKDGSWRDAVNAPTPQSMMPQGPESVSDSLMHQAEPSQHIHDGDDDDFEDDGDDDDFEDDGDDDDFEDDGDDDDFEDDEDAAGPVVSDLSRLIEVVKSGDFVVLDTETTGLYGDAEICQIAIVDSNGTTLLDTLVRPQKPIPADATRIHGITNDMVKPYPDWLNINEAVWQACKGKTVIVYNAEYDFKMIVQSEKACKPFALSDWNTVQRACAMLAYGEYRGIWNDYFGNWKWHKLSDAAARIGYTLPDGMKAHSALADCLMTLAVCRKLAAV